MSSVYCIEMYMECINSVLFVKVITLIHKNIRHKYQVILLLFYICYKEIPKKGKKILMAKDLYYMYFGLIVQTNIYSDFVD